MMGTPNGDRRPIQFWVAIIGIGGVALSTMVLIASVTALAIWGGAERTQSDTLNNALLLSLGGLVGMSGSVGAYLFTRGSMGEPIPPPTVRTTTPAGASGPTVTEIGGPS